MLPTSSVANIVKFVSLDKCNFKNELKYPICEGKHIYYCVCREATSTAQENRHHGSYSDGDADPSAWQKSYDLMTNNKISIGKRAS